MTLSPPLQQVDRTLVRIKNRKLTYFAGCDYFRLASEPRIHRAVIAGLKRHGLNVAASRITTGNHVLYEKLERELAKFFGAPTATLAANGYAPNLMVAQALAGEFSHALIDERAHGCLVDAAQLLGCPVLRFKHRNPADVVDILRRLGPVKPLLLTDGLFSHDGGIAPLKAYLAALPANGTVLLDDAHGAGVLGKHGRGTPEAAGVSRQRIIQTITLSKAFGVYGGAVLGSRALRDAIIGRSRLFAGNTPLPLPLANAALESVAILKSDTHLRERLQANIARVKAKLLKAGFAVEATPSPIISLAPPNAKAAGRLKASLSKYGIHPPFIKYPGGPVAGFFRFAISSEHSPRQLDGLAKALLEADFK